ncbi:hypothetical protein O1W68_01105 [Rhodococcus sp. H36-A4]|uniref:hypothetical protein n=1 Tax=Rhodococcus sp. H36-A4 TaxID=3004353 RepID=UPI0022AEC37D|nr:hypothetical protein [Rhodococcus sp. H36-A4]MCZ4076529.1 hypothetical protein [Rhodococcus sp. H36-A4]
MAPISETDQSAQVLPRRIEPDRDDDKSAFAPAVLAASATVVAALCGVVALSFESVVTQDSVTAANGEAIGAGVTVAELIALAPVVLVSLMAVLGVIARRAALTGAVTAGYGAVSAGLAVLDVGLLIDPIDSNRLELFRPITAAALQPGAGAYLILAAHVLAALGGLFGLVAVSRASMSDGYGHSTHADMTNRASAIRIGGWLSVLAVAAAAVAAGSMFASPYYSSDAIVLVSVAIDSPMTTSVGSGIVALAVLIVVAAVLASISPNVAAGASVGAGLGMLGVTGSRVVAGASSGPGVDAAPGSWVGVIASAVLVVVGIVLVPVSKLRERRGVSAEVRRATPVDSTSATNRWHVVAGVVGVATGVLIVTGALLPTLTVPDGLPAPTILATRVAAVAGFIVVLASIPMFFSVLAATVRPALGVLTAAAVMGASGVLQSVVLAADIDGIALGVGGIATALGTVGAVLCGGCVLLAGSAEREDVDTSDMRVDVRLGSAAWLGALLSVAGLALPLYRGTDVTAAWFGTFPWGWDVWGQAFLAVTIVVSAVVASRSRPARGTALLVGCVIAMIIYLLGWPLTKTRALEPVIGPGVIVGALGALTLAVAALLSARSRLR